MTSRRLTLDSPRAGYPRRGPITSRPTADAAIEKHARGDVEALARGIIEELREAGLEIRRTDAIPIRNPGC
jgi:hypothetical protein